MFVISRCEASPLGTAPRGAGTYRPGRGRRQRPGPPLRYRDLRPRRPSRTASARGL